MLWPLLSIQGVKLLASRFCLCLISSNVYEYLWKEKSYTFLKNHSAHKWQMNLSKILSSILKWQRPFKWWVTKYITLLVMKNTLGVFITHLVIKLQTFTYILSWSENISIGPWRKVHSNMGFVNKPPSKKFWLRRVGKGIGPFEEPL